MKKNKHLCILLSLYLSLNFNTIFCSSENTELPGIYIRAELVPVFLEFINVRTQLIVQDEVLQHELPIHLKLLETLTELDDQIPDKNDQIYREHRRFANVIRLRADKYSRYKELKDRLQISQKEEKRLPLIIRIYQMIEEPQQTRGSRRSRSNDDDATEITSQISTPPNSSLLSASSRFFSSQDRSSSEISAQSDQTIAYDENNS